MTAMAYYAAGMSLVMAVLGATGAVGRQMVSILEQSSLDVGELRLLATARSAGTTLSFRGRSIEVREATDTSFDGVDIALFSAGATPSRHYAPLAAQAGAVVIDNSSAWRRDERVPLVVPEVNGEQARHRPLGIIANPNCSTIQMVVALAPLHRAARIDHVVVSTYQSVSGKGHAAVEELWNHTRALASGENWSPQVFPGPIAMNVLSDWKPGDDDYSEEEWKMVFETRKILGDDSIGVSPTTVRVPVPVGHAESVWVSFRRPMDPAEAKELLSKAPGIRLVDEPYRPGGEPQPTMAAGTDAVWVGRVRRDLARPGAIQMWVVADNLRKGAALNAVQIAEMVAG